MKKLVMTVAVLACAASIVSAQTVTSANMVGYTKVTAIGGELVLVALNFEPVTNLVTEIIGEQLPFQSNLYVWDQSTDSYRSYSKSGRAAPGSWPSTATLSLGEAVWIEAPAGSGTNEVIFSGEVLLAETNSLVVATPTPFEMVGFSYPVDIAFGDTALSEQLPFQSSIYFWDAAIPGYVPYTKSGRAAPGTWSAEAQATIIPASGGFWLESGDGNSVLWEEPRPFTP